MKILFVTDLYPINGGSEPKTLFYFIKKWKQFGHHIDIIRPNFILNTLLRRKKIYKTGAYTNDGIRIWNANYITPFFFNIYNKLPEGFSIEEYDVIVAHMPSGILFTEKINKESKIPSIYSVHCSDIEVLTDPVYKMYFCSSLKKAYKKSIAISARSPLLKQKIEYIIPDTKDKTFVAFSGIDKELIEPEDYFLNKAERISNKKNIEFVTVSSLIKRKRIDLIILALSKLKETNWHYTIIGDGKEKNYLIKLVKNLKLEKNIEFTGKIKRNEVLKKLRETDIFILLSKRETFGMAYLEAMAKANIVIAAQNEGIDGIIKNGINGFTTSHKPNDLKILISNILNMNKEQKEHILKNAHKTVYQYDSENAAYNYIENIKKFIKSHMYQA